MKPYKTIRSQNPCLKRKKLVGKLKPPKAPLRLFKNVHPPKRVVVTHKGQEMEVAPSDVMLDDKSMTEDEIIQALPDHPQGSFFRYPNP